MQPPTTSPSNVQALMPFVMQLITGFLSEVSKLPPEEQTRRVQKVLVAMRADAP